MEMKKSIVRILMSALILGIVFSIAHSVSAQVTEEWAARYNSPGNGFDYVNALFVDPKGNVYVTGNSGPEGGPYDYVTVKYDRDGNELWVARYSSPGNADDQAKALVVDRWGNVYVAGTSWTQETADYVTVKYDPDGNELWVARYPGTEDSNAYVAAIALDVSRKVQNVYVTGGSWTASGGYDYATIKYDPDGNELWVAIYNSPGDLGDYPAGLAVDAQGDVYVTGTSRGEDSYTYDYFTIKYTQD